jgi:hypothetical protein
MLARLGALPGQYAKFLTALVGAALVFAQVFYGSQTRWVVAVTLAVAALGVAAVPNVPKPPPPGVPPIA